LDSILISRIFTVIIFVFIIGVIVVTGLFIAQVLNTSTAAIPDSSSTDQAAVEAPNTQLLDEVDNKLKTKTQTGLPNTDEMRNPFLIPAILPVAPTPAPPAPPPEPEPPAPSPFQ
jgi:hypothetical protein